MKTAAPKPKQKQKKATEMLRPISVFLFFLKNSFSSQSSFSRLITQQKRKMSANFFGFSIDHRTRKAGLLNNFPSDRFEFPMSRRDDFSKLRLSIRQDIDFDHHFSLRNPLSLQTSRKTKPRHVHQ